MRLLLASSVLLAACGTRLDDRVGVAANGEGGAQGGVEELSEFGESEGLAESGGTGGATGGTEGGPGTNQTTGAGVAGGASTGGGAGGASTGGGAGKAAKKNQVVVIGVTFPLSGPTGDIGSGGEAAFDSYLRAVNDAGGVEGTKFKVVTYDDRGDSSQNLANVKKLVEEDKAFVIFGGGVSAYDYLERAGVPNFAVTVDTQAFRSRYTTTFPLVGAVLQWQSQYVRSLNVHLGVKPKKVAVLYDGLLNNGSTETEYYAKAWKDAGAEVTSQDQFSLTDGDCTSLVLKVRNAGIDHWDFEASGWPLCVAAAERAGYRPPMGWGAIWSTSLRQFLDIAGPHADGVYSGSYWDDPKGRPGVRGADFASGKLDVPGKFTGVYDEMKRFRDTVKKYRPRTSDDRNMDQPFAVGGWLGAKFIADGIRATGGELDRKKFLQWGRSLKNWDADFVPAVQSFAPNCKTGSEYIWETQWKADGDNWVREPATPWMTTPLREQYGGKCWLTKLADTIWGK